MIANHPINLSFMKSFPEQKDRDKCGMSLGGRMSGHDISMTSIQSSSILITADVAIAKATKARVTVADP